MRSNYRLGRWLGVDIRLHFTFVLLMAFLSLVQLVRHGMVAALASAVFTAAVFAIVLLHEMGHVLAARRFGIRTRDVTLYPIGGIASLEREPRTPTQELWVSLAGPAVNLGLALILAAMAVIANSASPVGTPALGTGLLSRLVWVNLVMAGFNLLPAFPLDGGRVLRALLERRKGRLAATRTAARMGQLLAASLGLYALAASQALVGLVAIFIWMGASEELRRVAQVFAPASGLDETWASAAAGPSVGPATAFGGSVWAQRSGPVVTRTRPSVLRRVSPFFGGRRVYRVVR
jgi:Zn-dependent protease